jgi:Asp-tRNA(Asn)/Glu-tRNA(Gln) amidotransferase C subunit
MTIEQMQQISELATLASNQNDIDSLIKLKKIIDQDQQNSEFKTLEGSEWFESLLTGDQIVAVNEFS